MKNKICPKCKCEKEVSCFYFKKLEKRYESWCKSCVYQSQKQRWHDRKKKAIELLGGKCCNCGYDKNHAALDFHHVDPSTKSYQWDELRLKCWKSIVNELQKCILLCRNCHAEHHWKEHENTYCENNKLNTEQPKIQSTGKCKKCNEDVYGTIYCSLQCASYSKRKVSRPSADELKEMISKKSYCAIAKEYGVSDNSIRKWAKSYGLFKIKE